MIGPLPTLYRAVVALCVLSACAGVGAWLSYSMPGPILAGTGAGIGSAVGVIATFLLLHDFGAPGGPGNPAPRRIRIR
ncbi:MAG: hypothetical protein ACRDPB_04905 [Nocardioidaceae bacterium]